MYKNKVTIDELKACGLKFENINLLYQKGLILVDSNNPGVYTISNLDELVRFSSYTYRIVKDHFLAISYCKLCYMLNPTYPNISYYLFKFSSFLDDWSMACEYLKTILSMPDERNKPNNLFYLFVLRYIVDLPEELKEFAKNINYLDVIETENNSQIIKKINYIKNKAMFGSFAYAAETLKRNFPNAIGSLSLIEQLICSAATIEKIRMQKLLETIRNHEYELALDILFTRCDQRRLKNSEKICVSLVRVLINMERGIYPKPANYYGDDVFEAIETHDYESARFLAREKWDNSVTELNNNIIYVLLTQINEAIDMHNNMNSLNTFKEQVKQHIILPTNKNE